MAMLFYEFVRKWSLATKKWLTQKSTSLVQEMGGITQTIGIHHNLHPIPTFLPYPTSTIGIILYDMYKNVWFAGLLLVAAIFYSCEKEEHTLPASMKMTLRTEVSDGMNGDFQLTGLEIWSDDFRFRGNRSVGEDIDFLLSFPEPRQFSLSGPGFPAVNADIPQGIYSSFEISWNIAEGTGNYDGFQSVLEDYLDDDDSDDDSDDGGDDGDDDTGDDTDDDVEDDAEGDDLEDVLESYFEFIVPGVKVEATLLDGTTRYRVLFVLDDGLRMDIPATLEDGSSEISFLSGAENEFLLAFDTEYWVRPLSREVFRNARSAENDEDEEVIFIQKSINTELYTILLSRFEDSFRLMKL